MEKQLVANRVECLNCGEIVQSKYRHDFQACKCENRTCADGGIDYLRYGGRDMKLVNPKPIYLEDGHHLVRSFMYWGNNYDKDKNLLPETKWLKIKDLNDGHLEALIELRRGTWLGDVFETEKAYRNDLH